MGELEKLLEKNKTKDVIKAEKARQAVEEARRRRKAVETRHSLSLLVILVLSLLVTWLIYLVDRNNPSIKDKPGRYQNLSPDEYERLKAWDDRMN